jgi:hypothetical protein
MAESHFAAQQARTEMFAERHGPVSPNMAMAQERAAFARHEMYAERAERGGWGGAPVPVRGWGPERAWEHREWGREQRFYGREAAIGAGVYGLTAIANGIFGQGYTGYAAPGYGAPGYGQAAPAAYYGQTGYPPQQPATAYPPTGTYPPTASPGYYAPANSSGFAAPSATSAFSTAAAGTIASPTAAPQPAAPAFPTGSNVKANDLNAVEFQRLQAPSPGFRV